MPEVQVSVAAPAERATLENLMQLYIHDFSEHWSGGPQGELGADGRFPAYPLDAYWREPTHTPLLLRLDGRLAGFALLDAASHTGQSVDRNMAEFFIVRKHRRAGAGTAAAQAIFSSYPGVWETAIVRRNLAALAFWRGIVGAHPDVEGLSEFDVTTPAWNGPVLRFRVRPAG